MPLRFRILPADDAQTANGDHPVGPLVARNVEVSDAVDEIRLGRRADVELPLPFAVLSGVHARLYRLDGSWFVEDAGSTNGTWLDGAPLAPGERRPLATGAELRLASVRLRFAGAGPAAPAAAAEGTATIARRLVADLFDDSGGGAPTIRITRGAAPASLALRALGRAYVVGRAESCALPLGVEEVSREHAAFVRGAEGVLVRDLGSKNGVIVGGVRIAGDHALADGDLVEVGPVTMTLEDPVSRYLRELERMAADPPLVVAALAVPPDLPSETPRRPSSTSLVVGVAVSVLVLLAIAAALLVFARA
jgi:pSer/pThr/pTyr-binding forkhead associated (FHA) protein